MPRLLFSHSGGCKGRATKTSLSPVLLRSIFQRRRPWKRSKEEGSGEPNNTKEEKAHEKSTLRGGCGDEKRKICSLVFCFLPCSSRSVSLSLSRCPYIHTRTYTGTPTHACVYVRTAALRCWLVVRFSLFFFFFLTTLAKKAALSAVRRELEELRGGVTIIIIICFLFAVFVCFLLFKT
jgi:hypothetical protein